MAVGDVVTDGAAEGKGEQQWRPPPRTRPRDSPGVRRLRRRGRADVCGDVVAAAAAGRWSPACCRGRGHGMVAGIIASADKSAQRLWGLSPQTRRGESERDPLAQTRPRHGHGDHRHLGQVRSDYPGGYLHGRGYQGERNQGAASADKATRQPIEDIASVDKATRTSLGSVATTTPQQGQGMGATVADEATGLPGVITSAEKSAGTAVEDVVADEAEGREGAEAETAVDEVMGRQRGALLPLTRPRPQKGKEATSAPVNRGSVPHHFRRARKKCPHLVIAYQGRRIYFCLLEREQLLTPSLKSKKRL